MTPEQRAKAIRKKPWKFCKKCQADIKSATGYCHACYTGEGVTANPYGLVNTSVNYRLTKSEERR